MLVISYTEQAEVIAYCLVECRGDTLSHVATKMGQNGATAAESCRFAAAGPNNGRQQRLASDTQPTRDSKLTLNSQRIKFLTVE